MGEYVGVKKVLATGLRDLKACPWESRGDQTRIKKNVADIQFLSLPKRTQLNICFIRNM